MITCLFMSFACLAICFPFWLIHCNTWQIMTLCPVLSTFYLLSIFFVFLCLLSYRSFEFSTYSALLVFLKMLFWPWCLWNVRMLMFLCGLWIVKVFLFENVFAWSSVWGFAQQIYPLLCVLSGIGKTHSPLFLHY